MASGLLAKEHYDVVPYFEDRTEHLERNPELLPACQVMSGLSPSSRPGSSPRSDVKSVNLFGGLRV
jgi:hypothetical protein